MNQLANRMNEKKYRIFQRFAYDENRWTLFRCNKVIRAILGEFFAYVFFSFGYKKSTIRAVWLAFMWNWIGIWHSYNLSLWMRHWKMVLSSFTEAAHKLAWKCNMNPHIDITIKPSNFTKSFLVFTHRYYGRTVASFWFHIIITLLHTFNAITWNYKWT